MIGGESKIRIANERRYNGYGIGMDRSKGDSKNGRREGNGKGTNSFCTARKLAFVDRLRDQERKQDLCDIDCAATAKYTGSV